MTDYQKAKIYKIVDVNEEMVYVGSTVNTLAKRMAHHRADYKRQHFITSHLIFNKYGIENCKILLLENYPCNSKDELNKREGEIIRELDCVNKVLPNQTDEEWRKKNKDVLAEKSKEYRKNNQEQIKEIKKIYYEKNKEQIREKQNNNYAMKKKKE
jgi:Uri superfamily endonuclease